MVDVFNLFLLILWSAFIFFVGFYVGYSSCVERVVRKFISSVELFEKQCLTLASKNTNQNLHKNVDPADWWKNDDDEEA